MNRFKFFKFLICFGFVILNFGFKVTPIHAQSVSLSVSPPVIEMIIAPGKSVTQSFTLDTQGEEVSITPTLHKAIPVDSMGHVLVDPKPLDLKTLPLAIKISGPDTSPTLTFTAENTDKAADVYLALVFEATSPTPLNKSTTTTPAISALILATVNPTGVIPINLEIKDFSPPLIHDSWDPLIMIPTLTNSTSIMIRPIGSYEIINPWGKSVFSLPLYPNLILGNSDRKILGSHTRCEGSPHTGCVDLAPISLTWSPTWKNIGPYRLHLTLTTQGGTKITDIEKVVWIFPIKITIYLVIIFIFIAIKLLRRRRLTLPQ
ncbi:MAG: hypothetical protein ABII21_03710 [bacterium]